MTNKRPELKPYLLNHINSQDNIWHRKVDLYIIGDEIEFSPESVGRALRDLAEEEKIKVDYYDGKWVKGLAKYASLGTEKPKVQKPLLVLNENGDRVAKYI